MLCPAMSMLLIPEPPGAKIIPFHLAENQLESMIEEIKKVDQQLYINNAMNSGLIGCILLGK